MIKKIIQGVIILLILMIVYNLSSQIMDALKSSERLSKAADAVYQLEAKNRELKKKLAQVSSYEFIETEARNKLGFSKPGETVVIIPDDKLKLIMGTTQSAQIRLPNFLGWFKVFFK